MEKTGHLYEGPTRSESRTKGPTRANRLLIDFSASTPGDYVRVLTMESPVPEPSTAVLFGIGLAGLAGFRGRER